MMKKSAIILAFLLLLFTTILQAQTPLERGTLPTLIAPAYFGPNAFQVPQMTDGTTKSRLTIDLSADGDFGFAGDRTATLFGRIYIPLFTDRVNLVIWMPLQEWWHNTTERQTQCRLMGNPISGHGAGDAYVSTDIMILREKKFVPSITIRAALRSASGEDYPNARFYDSPGYFFDGSIGKSLWFNKQTSRQLELRMVVSSGFLCWQTANARQNDAVMYGVLVSLRHQYISATVQYTGYAGWENKGDRPMVIRAQVRGNIPLKSEKIRQSIQPFAQYQYGIKDFPFQIVSIGIGYDLDILPHKE